VKKEGKVDELSFAYVIAQEPSPDGGVIEMETPIHLIVSKEKPESCE